LMAGRSAATKGVGMEALAVLMEVFVAKIRDRSVSRGI